MVTVLTDFLKEEAEQLCEFCFCVDPTVKLEPIIGLVNFEQAEALKIQLALIGARYRRRCAQTQVSKTKAEQRVALRRVKSTSPNVQRKGLRALENSPDAEFKLRLAAKTNRTEEQADAIYALPLDDLRELATTAHKNWPDRRGPQPNNDLYFLVQELLDLYELTTCQYATHNPQLPAGVYKGGQDALNSPADRFVALCIMEILSAVREIPYSADGLLPNRYAMQVVTAMEYALRHRCAERPAEIKARLPKKSPKRSK